MVGLTMNKKFFKNIKNPIFNDYSGKKILIVDDEKEIRDIIKETLMVDDFKVLEADSGDLAWQVVREQNPDLVLMDVKMPGSIDGFEVCNRIKTNHQTKKIPVIFLTGFRDKNRNKEWMNRENIFYKPFSPIQLVDKIYDVLNKSH